MKPKHIPMRTCVGCRSAKPKRELIRIVKTPEGDVTIDATGKKSGRGAYICPSKACLHKVLQGKQLDRALNTEIDAELKVSLEQQIDG